MKLKIFLSIFCLTFINLAHSMDEKTDAESLKNTLFNAVCLGNIDLVKRTLEKGVVVNAKDCWDRTALIEAARRKHIDIVQVLLEKGANVNAKDYWGETALIEAARMGHIDIVQVLLEYNTNLNIRNRFYSHTALFNAKMNNHSSVIQMIQDEPARRWFNWLRTRHEISQKTPLFPDLANVVAEYLEPDEDYEEYFV